MEQYSYNTSIGDIYIATDKDFITYIGFTPLVIPYKETYFIKQAYKQLTEYLNKERKVFDLPIQYNGTDFQKAVWEALLTVPYGTTVSYKDVAKMIHRPRSYRAVGNAIHNNPISIVIPCHRVIKNDGRLGGYAGNEDRKLYLLEMERD